MNHLTEQEIFDYADARTTAPDTDASRHLAECAACRAAVALQRRIGSAASHADDGLLPNTFTARVMSRIVTPHTSPRFSWLTENSANIFAMVFVVGIIVSIIYIVTQSTPDAGESVYAQQFSFWRTAYTSVVDAVAARNRESLVPVESITQHFSGTTFLMGIGALILLGSLDKLVTYSRRLRAR